MLERINHLVYHQPPLWTQRDIKKKLKYGHLYDKTEEDFQREMAPKKCPLIGLREQCKSDKEKRERESLARTIREETEMGLREPSQHVDL